MKKIGFPLILSISVFLMAACGGSSAGSGISPCDVNDAQLGALLEVSGVLAFIDDSAEDLIYADLEDGDCRIGIAVRRSQYQSWKHETRAAFGLDADITVRGILTEVGLPARPDEMQFVIAMESAPKVHAPGSGGGIADVEGGSCYCDCSGMVVGDKASVRGVVTLLETDTAAGIYAEIETQEGCLQRIWVEERFWEAWTQAERGLFSSGEEIALEGLLTLVLGQLTIDIALPPMQ